MILIIVFLVVVQVCDTVAFEALSVKSGGWCSSVSTRPVSIPLLWAQGCVPACPFSDGSSSESLLWMGKFLNRCFPVQT